MLKELQVVQSDCISNYEVGLKQRNQARELERAEYRDALDNKPEGFNFIVKAMDSL